MAHLRACEGCGDVYPTSMDTWIKNRVGAWFCRWECYRRWYARLRGKVVLV